MTGQPQLLGRRYRVADNTAAERHRALKCLATSPHGQLESVMFTLGFAHNALDDLQNAGLIIKEARHLRVGSRWVDASRIWITEAGRRAIAEHC